MNSGPLSDRRCSGIPRHSITSDNVSITSRPFSLRATRSAVILRYPYRPDCKAVFYQDDLVIGSGWIMDRTD